MNDSTYEMNRIKMAMLAKGLSISALGCTLVLASPFLGITVGSFALLFAWLSKGTRHKFDRDSKLAAVQATIALLVSLYIIGLNVFRYQTDPEYKKRVETTFSFLTHPEEYSEDYMIK